MKKTRKPDTPRELNEELRSEYRFDYRKAKSSRFVGQAVERPVVVLLDSDVSEVFRTIDSVNAVLRALIQTMPLATKPKKVQADSKQE